MKRPFSLITPPILAIQVQQRSCELLIPFSVCLRYEFSNDSSGCCSIPVLLRKPHDLCWYATICMRITGRSLGFEGR